MPVPSTINDIYTVAGSNPPGGGETPAEGDNHLRAAYSFIALLRDILNGTSSTTASVQSLAVSGAAAFGSMTVSGAAAFNGNTTIGNSGSDTLTVNAAATFADAVDFDVTPTGKVTSGTYTPTLTNGTDVSASTPSACQYARIGDFVVVSGQVSVTTSSDIGDLFTLGISLPIASNFAAAGNLGGSGADASTQSTVRPVEFIADTTNDRASMRGRVTVGATPFTYSFLFAYQVI
jgi:hypothetical protein